jgi:hypothetical protein
VQTIKTQLANGQRRVITKFVNGQRRVSCSCCETGCCPYPAQAYIDGLITFGDLPNSFKTENDRWVKRELPEQLNETTIIIYDLVGGEDFEESMALSTEFEDQPLWDFLIGGVSHDCLIDDFWRDEFADTYTITALSQSVTVTRQSLCLWSGFDSCGFKWQLTYGFQGLIQSGPAQEYGWNIIVSENDENCSAPDYSLGTKSGFQNTPVGSYGGNVDGAVS